MFNYYSICKYDKIWVNIGFTSTMFQNLCFKFLKQLLILNCKNLNKTIFFSDSIYGNLGTCKCHN